MDIKIEKKNEYFEICSDQEKWNKETPDEMDIPENCKGCPSAIKEFCDRGEEIYERIPDWEIYDRAVDQWGIDAQLNEIMEELAELIIECNKVRRDKNGSDLKEFAEELADAEIMIEQGKRILAYHIGDFKNINEIKRDKLERLYGMIQEEK